MLHCTQLEHGKGRPTVLPGVYPARSSPNVRPCCAAQVWTWILNVIVLLAGASSSIGSLGAAVAVEREYAKTLCGHDSAALRKLNSGKVLMHSGKVLMHFAASVGGFFIMVGTSQQCVLAHWLGLDPAQGTGTCNSSYMLHRTPCSTKVCDILTAACPASVFV